MPQLNVTRCCLIPFGRWSDNLAIMRRNMTAHPSTSSQINNLLFVAKPCLTTLKGNSTGERQTGQSCRSRGRCPCSMVCDSMNLSDMHCATTQCNPTLLDSLCQVHTRRIDLDYLYTKLDYLNAKRGVKWGVWASGRRVVSASWESCSGGGGGRGLRTASKMSFFVPSTVFESFLVGPAGNKF